MSEWIKCSDRLPSKSGIYPACSMIESRTPPQDWVDALCHFDARAKPGHSKWQHSSGFYDNGITHWLELPPPPSE